MIGGKINLVFGIITLCTGLFVGASGYSFLFCPDTDKAIVKLLRKDAKKVEVIKEKKVIRKQKNERTKIIIRTVKDTTGCNRVPSPELRDVLLDSLSGA